MSVYGYIESDRPSGHEAGQNGKVGPPPIEHVPPLIQAEIETAVEIVHQVGKKDVAMIWLYGSYAPTFLCSR